MSDLHVGSEVLPAKVALVTGASSGIGAATAELLAESGYAVGMIARDADGLQEIAQRLEGDGHPAMVLPADIGDPKALDAAYRALISRWRRLDVVVANAGINGVWCPLSELQVEEWDETFRINARGTFLTLHLAIPHLTAHGGSIIVVSSINGSRIFGNLGASAYASSKAAQVALAKMAARELAPHRIRVNVVCPGSIRTGIESSMKARALAKLGTKGAHGIPLTHDQPGSAMEVAKLIRFLASDESDHITGTEIFIDGAESLFGS